MEKTLAVETAENIKMFESKFRQGASHAASFLNRRASELLRDGASADEIVSTLRDLGEVVLDWREKAVTMPDGNPWDWKSSELTAFVEKRRNDW